MNLLDKLKDALALKKGNNKKKCRSPIGTRTRGRPVRAAYVTTYTMEDDFQLPFYSFKLFLRIIL